MRPSKTQLEALRLLALSGYLDSGRILYSRGGSVRVSIPTRKAMERAGWIRRELRNGIGSGYVWRITPKGRSLLPSG